MCPRLLGQCSIHQRGESIDKGSGGVGVGEWKEQELIHGERLWEAKAQGGGMGVEREGDVELREQGEGKLGEGRGVKETDEAIWVKKLV